MSWSVCAVDLCNHYNFVPVLHIFVFSNGLEMVIIHKRLALYRGDDVLLEFIADLEVHKKGRQVQS